MSVTSVAIHFTLIDALSRGVDRIKSRMKGLAAANKEVQNSFDNMARSAKYAAIAAMGTREIYKGLKPAVAVAGDLQAEMLGARAEMAGSVKDAKELGRQLKQIQSNAFQIQATLPLDQAQIVALEKELLKAGAKIEAVVGKQGAAAASAALAVYEKMDPVETGKNLIGIATPFGLRADQFMNLADQIARASSASTVGAAEIVETAKYAAPAMSELKKSSGQMLELSAALAQVGIDSSMAGVAIRQFYKAAAGLKAFKNADGSMKTEVEMAEVLQKTFAKMGESDRLARLNKIFGDRGYTVALALMKEGEGSLAMINAAMSEAITLQEKLDIMMSGYHAQLGLLRGTFRSTIAALYLPALKPLTYIVAKMNEFVGLIGQVAQRREALGKVVSGASLGGLAAGGLATVGLGAAALWYARKMSKGVGGIKGLFGGAGSAAAGIAAGKAVEAATGVTPVFVTNWPAGGVGGGLGGLAGTKTGRGLLTKAGQLARSGWGRMLGLPGSAKASLLGARALALGRLAGMGGLGSTLAGSAGAVGAGTLAGTVAGAGALGYGAGSLANKYLIDGTALGDKIGEALNRIAAFFGNEASRQAIEINMRIDEERRVTTNTNSMTTVVKPELRRGRF